MIEQSILVKQFSSEYSDATTSRLRQEYQAYQKLFLSQPGMVQQYLKNQAVIVAEAIINNQYNVHFSLPDYVTCLPMMECVERTLWVPIPDRIQMVGGLVNQARRIALEPALLQRFMKLERSENQAISVSAGLLRYAIATHLIYQVLPAGKSVLYTSTESGDIPNMPLVKGTRRESVATAELESHSSVETLEKAPAEFQAPYIMAAQIFYLPQWVAFDDQGAMLTATPQEAESYIASMQQYLSIINSAVAIAPYMVVDEICQQKRYGILGQLVNQGRAWSRYMSGEIIQNTQHRVIEHRLDRGVRISLPYFNDKTLQIEQYDFVIIPAGWIMFIPAFAVLAARQQQIKVAQDTRLSFTTRKHLITELHNFELAFSR